METLVRICAVASDRSADYFNPKLARPNVIQRFAYVLSRPSFEDSECSITPHTDSGFMALLAPAVAPGLAIRLQDGM